MNWILQHQEAVVTVLLLVSEALQVFFPSKEGFGGFIGSVVRFLSNLKKPAADEAAK